MRALLFALLAALALGPGCGPAATRPDPAIWRIADADSEIWLFGSVHMLPPDLRWRSARVNAAFAASEEFWTETEMGEGAVAAFAALLERHGALPAGQTLADRIGEADAARVANAALVLGMPAEALERRRPWLVAMQLSATAAQQKGYRPEAGVEAVLGAEADRRGMQRLHFETLEEQVRVLADLAPADEARLLGVTLRDVESGGASLSAMDQAWVRGDTAELARQLDAEWEAAGPGVHEAVILARNRRWADAIEARLDGAGTSFVAVGAAHLVGEGNVVTLLRERGIAVEGP